MNQDWTEQNFRDMSINNLKILNLFIAKKKTVITTDDLRKEFGIKDGRVLGGMLGGINKFKNKEPLLIKVGTVHNNTKDYFQTSGRWVLNKKYIPLLKKLLPQLYLDL